MPQISVYDRLAEIKGIGRYVAKLERLGMETAGDLLRRLPVRYEDFSNVRKIRDLKIGETATVRGVVKSIKISRGFRRRIFIVHAIVSDKTGNVRAMWFNQKYLLKAIPSGTEVNIAGKIYEEKKGKKPYFYNPVFELVNASVEEDEDEDVDELPVINLDEPEKKTRHTARIIPIYPESRGLSSKAFRFLMGKILDNFSPTEDFIPLEILQANNFPEINSAFRHLHFPQSMAEAKAAKKRFSFEDIFLLQLVNLESRKNLEKERAHALKIDLEEIKKVIEHLPFSLTLGQKNALWEIIKDLQKPQPMNRLLQGDVGSGKTIIAAIAAYLAAQNGRQAVFMAPTEVLANQHYRTIRKFFPDFEKGLGILTASESRVFYGKGLESKTKKTDFLKQTENGEIKIIIGTHSLIAPKARSKKGMDFHDLALVVLDEQHRFGVRQRSALVEGQKKDKILPHLLSMSATPIPRTLSLTLFGDLDLSVINELPKNRKAIITKIVSPENRDKAYAFIRGQVKKSRQVFVVCPRIEKNAEATGEDGISYEPLRSEKPDLKSVKDEYEELANNVFPDLRVEMLHGKLKAAEKEEIMKKFSGGEIDVLVSTSVIEVGVDVPNASIMMIEGSDRFGLAQLYQFRGRVGRGEHQSFCFLFTDSFSPQVQDRLNAVVNAKNGFELAEMDLRMRGPGEILGEAQTGMPDLAMKVIHNPELIKESREAALKILQEDLELTNYPLLKERLERFEKAIHME